MESDTLIKDTEFDKINSIYDECIQYLETIKETDCDEDQLLIQNNTLEDEYGAVDPTYEIIKESIKLKTIQSNNNVNEDPKYESIKTPKEIKKIQNNIHNGPKFESKKASSETEIILNDINKKEDPKYETIKTPSTIKSKQNNKNDPEYEKIKAPIETKTKQNNTNNKEIEDKALKEGNKQNKVNFANDENENLQTEITEAKNVMVKSPVIKFKVENELAPNETQIPTESRSERLRRLSKQLPRIVITQSNSSLNKHKEDCQSRKGSQYSMYHQERKKSIRLTKSPPPSRTRAPYGDFPKRLVSKSGMENVALISNVPYEKIRLLNDTFHTLINLRWRWIVIGTIVVHFAIWLIFAVFWYITALAHYDFEPDPPKRGCITGGTDFVTIFLASVEAQTTIGFGDRAIDEECPESIFLFIMQLILGTGLSGVLTCVVYAKLTRPEKLSRDGVGFSKKAVICMRDGHLCLMMRAWDLNYDHIISSEFSAHFVNTHKTKEGEIIRYYARSLMLQQRQFLLWPVTLVHVIDVTSPLYKYTPEQIANNSYEITVSLKGASASMGTFTQSQTSYMPREIIWGHRFPPVVKYDSRKQKYVIDHKKLDTLEPVDTPYCSADELYNSIKEDKNNEDLSSPCPGTPSSFSEKISAFVLERTSSFRRNNHRS